MLECVKIAAIIFNLYVCVSIILFGCLKSLSETFYLYNLLNPKYKNLGWIFPIMLVCIVFLVIPYWMEITPESYQLLGFISCAGILMVFVSPKFKEKQEKTTHFIGAIVAAVGSLTWCFLQGDYLTVLIFTVFYLVLALAIKTLKTCYLFWLEMIAFQSLFFSMIFDF